MIGALKETPNIFFPDNSAWFTEQHEHITESSREPSQLRVRICGWYSRKGLPCVCGVDATYSKHWEGSVISNAWDLALWWELLTMTLPSLACLKHITSVEDGELTWRISDAEKRQQQQQHSRFGFGVRTVHINAAFPDLFEICRVSGRCPAEGGLTANSMKRITPSTLEAAVAFTLILSGGRKRNTV